MTNPIFDKPWLSVKEAQLYLGIKSNLLYDMMDFKGGPFTTSLICKPGARSGKRIVHRESIDAYILASKSERKEVDYER